LIAQSNRRCGSRVVSASAGHGRRTAPLTLKSPTGELEISIATLRGRNSDRAGGQLAYSVVFRGQPVLEWSNLWLLLDAAPALGPAVRIETAQPSSQDDYDSFERLRDEVQPTGGLIAGPFAQPCKRHSTAVTGPCQHTGIAWRDGEFADAGASHGDFKLREIARTAPYMHDGSLASLEDVVEYYDRGGNANPQLDSELHALHLSADEKRKLVQFMRSLSSR
jgi:hypothetical protein